MDFEQLDKELHQDKGFYTQQFELNKQIQQLEKEVTELKIANREFTEDFELQQKAINTLNNSGLKLMEENKKLVSKLANQKTEVGIVEVLKNNFFADEETLKDVMNYDLKRIEKYRKVRLEKLQQVAKEIMEGEATSQK